MDTFPYAILLMMICGEKQSILLPINKNMQLILFNFH